MTPDPPDLLPAPLAALAMHGREERNLEFKRTLDWSNRRTNERIAKACMAMANLRDGGAIVIGVNDAGVPVGITGLDVVAYTHDRIARAVNQYAAPNVDVTVTIGMISTRGDLVLAVIEVQPFSDTPIICRRDGKELDEGRMYIRGHEAHETVEVRRESEMREVLEVATERRVSAFIRTALLSGLLSVSRESGTPDDERAFDDQRDDL